MSFFILLRFIGSLLLLLAVREIIKSLLADRNKTQALSPEERQQHQEDKRALRLIMLHGQLNPALLCPHCQVQGQVRAKAVLPRGALLLNGGRGGRERRRHAYCHNCHHTWEY